MLAVSVVLAVVEIVVCMEGLEAQEEERKKSGGLLLFLHGLLAALFVNTPEKYMV